jgi:tetratricopeptide (TPR) repeat protein
VAPERRRIARLAGMLGDAELELQARMITVWDEPERRTAAAWDEIEQLAHELRRWPDVAEAQRVQTSIRLPDDLDGARVAAARLAAFAAAHELSEPRAWSAYYVCEVGLASGDWDGALAAGRDALDAAEAGSFHRAAARTWFALLPVAAARGELEFLERAAAWYDRLPSFPDSPYGRISRTAMDILLAASGLPSTFRIPLADLGSSVAEASALPSWFESLDIVVADALAAGEVEAVRRALETFRETLERDPSATGRATRTLLEARLALAEGAGREALHGPLALLGEHGRAWPLLKCLRLLVQAGEATPAESDEIHRLEALLGLAGPASR